MSTIVGIVMATSGSRQTTLKKHVSTTLTSIVPNHHIRELDYFVNIKIIYILWKPLLLLGAMLQTLALTRTSPFTMLNTTRPTTGELAACPFISQVAKPEGVVVLAIAGLLVMEPVFCKPITHWASLLPASPVGALPLSLRS